VASHQSFGQTTTVTTTSMAPCSYYSVHSISDWSRSILSPKNSERVTLYHKDPPCCMAASFLWPSLKTKSEDVQYWLCEDLSTFSYLLITIYPRCWTAVLFGSSHWAHGQISYIDIQSPYQFCGLSVISVIKHDQTKVLLMQPSGRIKWRFRWPWVSVQCFRTYGGGWRSIWKIGSDGALYI
jgi:hypothetical protein